MEAKLGPNFAKEKLKDFKRLIEASQSFTVISMPGVGVSYFLKYLTTTNLARSDRGARRAFFIHIDLYLLPTLSQHEFYRLFHREMGGRPGPKTDEQVFIETKDIIKNYAQKYDKVVVIFSRFDQLKKELDANFLSNLQALTTISPGSPRGEAGKIVLIFTAIKPLHELAPEAISGGNLTFYSKYLYFKPYPKEDLKKLLKLEPEPLPVPAQFNKLLDLSGGHIQLLHILLNSQKQQNLLLDQFVKLQMKELVGYLDHNQRKQVQKIALRQAQGKNFGEIDEYLLGVGMVKQSTSEVKKMPASPAERGERLHLGGVKFELFTPLLEEYIKTNLPVKLPVKEAKLFKLLRKNMGRTVPKDEIFAEVWPARNAPRSEAGGGEDNEGATDWALDALIYRLRKHPFMQNQGYLIESHKKVGYTLIQT